MKKYIPSGELIITRARTRNEVAFFPANYLQEYISSDEMLKKYGAKSNACLYAGIAENFAAATDTKQDFCEVGRLLINKYVDDLSLLDELIIWAELNKDKLYNYINDKIKNNEIVDFTNEELALTHWEYYQEYRNYNFEVTPSWWLTSPVIEEEFDKYIKGGDISMSDLSVLIDSLEYEYELEREYQNLLDIAGEVYSLDNKGIKTGYDNLPFKIRERIDKHVEEFGSIPFAYNSGLLWNKDYFMMKINEIIANGNPIELKEKKLKERFEKKEKQKELFDSLNLDEKLKKLILISRKIGYLQDLKKTHQTKSHPTYREVLLPEIAKRLRLDKKYLDFMTPHEVREALSLGSVEDDLLNNLIEREKNCVLITRNNEYEWLVGKDAVDFAEKYNLIQTDTKVDILKGNTASSGKVTGIARICLSSKEISKVKYGDILISSMTTPDYVPAMKIASAIVTDEGGITCHAAIVSRELKIPCIIGTKNATKVFRDGDIVEVDADNGIVRKIN